MNEEGRKVASYVLVNEAGQKVGFVQQMETSSGSEGEEATSSGAAASDEAVMNDGPEMVALPAIFGRRFGPGEPMQTGDFSSRAAALVHLHNVINAHFAAVDSLQAQLLWRPRWGMIGGCQGAAFPTFPNAVMEEPPRGGQGMPGFNPDADGMEMADNGMPMSPHRPPFFLSPWARFVYSRPDPEAHEDGPDGSYNHQQHALRHHSSHEESIDEVGEGVQGGSWKTVENAIACWCKHSTWGVGKKACFHGAR